jgi:hypothetical protein
MIGYESRQLRDREFTANEAFHERQLRRADKQTPSGDKFRPKHFATRDNIYRTAILLRRNGGDGAGPDGVKPADLTNSEIGAMAGQITQDIQRGRHVPGPRRTVGIPKNGGGTRHLRIPNFCDRVVGRLLCDTVQPLVDPYFVDMSYGFRPERGVWQLLAMLKSRADFDGKWIIVNADVRRAFESLPIDDVLNAYERLLAQTEFSKCRQRVRQSFLRLVRRVLQGGDDSRALGIDMGDPFSPMSLNVFMHMNHDLFFAEETNKPFFVRDCDGYRYADNLIFSTKSVSEGHQVLDSIRQHLLHCQTPVKDDARVHDLRDESEAPQILGFTLRCREDRLVFGLREDALHRLASALEEAYSQSDPAQAAKQAATGWIGWIGPVFESGCELPKRIARTMYETGFRDVLSLARIGDLCETSRRRWERLTTAVQVKHGLLVWDVW